MRHRIVHRAEALVAIATVLVLSAAVAWSYAIELRGPFVDAIASDVATRRVGLPVTVLDVRVRQWKDIRFGLMTVTTPDSRTLVACGSGRLVVDGVAFLKGEAGVARASFNDVALLEDLYRGWSMSAWAAGSAFEDPIFVKRLETTILQTESHSEIHVHRFDSEEVGLAGGLRWAGRRILKANAFILLPEARFERVPKELRARLIPRRQGWRGFRVTYGAGNLTVYGASGPFFRATWAAGS